MAPKKPGSAFRRIEEDTPGIDYLEQLTKLGPREGESYYAFSIRLARVREARLVILAVAEHNKGNITEICRVLGISLSYFYSAALGMAGLVRQDIHDFKPVNRAVDQPLRISPERAQAHMRAMKKRVIKRRQQPKRTPLVRS